MANAHPPRVAEFYRAEPGQLQRAMTDVAGDFVARRTVVVGLFDPNCERVFGRGTGTCVSIGGRYLVATAGHLFIGVPEPYCVGVMPLTTTPSRDIFLATRHNRRGGGKTDPEDVAWLELSAATARVFGRQFLTLDGIDPHYAGAAGEPLFSYGFPDQVEITPKAHGQSEFGLSVQCYSTFVMAPTSIDPSCRPDPAFDIFARYSTRPLDENLPEGRVPKLPGAPGLSGGGFWRVNVNKLGIWTPDDLKLVGIEHAWLPEDEWFRATKICHWLRLVAHDHPDLASLIDPVLLAPP
jgi:hypothetical protein